jgi:hypothetical protein
MSSGNKGAREWKAIQRQNAISLTYENISALDHRLVTATARYRVTFLNALFPSRSARTAVMCPFAGLLYDRVNIPII